MDLTRFTPVSRVRTALIALAVIVGLALAGIVVWKVFFAGTTAKRVAAEAVVGQEAAEGQSRAAEAALGKIIIRTEEHRIIEERVQKGETHVYQTEGSRNSVGAQLDAAGRNALCMHDTYQRANDCPGLPTAGASSPAATDAERNGS
jgi:hypothetical protein